MQRIMFLEGNWVSASGGRAAVEHVDGSVYLALSLRNVGSGIAVCQGWAARPTGVSQSDLTTHVPLEDFRLQSRDLYIPAGDIGMWQGALRNPDDTVRANLVDALETGQRIMVEVLYSDLVGRQRTISRFGLVPAEGSWIASLNRHWYLDWDGPRPDDLTVAASEVIIREHEAAAQRREEAEHGDLEADAGGSVGADGSRFDAQRADPADHVRGWRGPRLGRLRRCRTRRASSTTRTAASADSPLASPPNSPGGRAQSDRGSSTCSPSLRRRDC